MLDISSVFDVFEGEVEKWECKENEEKMSEHGLVMCYWEKFWLVKNLRKKKRFRYCYSSQVDVRLVV